MNDGQRKGEAVEEKEMQQQYGGGWGRPTGMVK